MGGGGATSYFVIIQSGYLIFSTSQISILQLSGYMLAYIFEILLRYNLLRMGMGDDLIVDCCRNCMSFEHSHLSSIKPFHKW